MKKQRTIGVDLSRDFERLRCCKILVGWCDGKDDRVRVADIRLDHIPYLNLNKQYFQHNTNKIAVSDEIRSIKCNVSFNRAYAQNFKDTKENNSSGDQDVKTVIVD